MAIKEESPDCIKQGDGRQLPTLITLVPFLSNFEGTEGESTPSESNRDDLFSFNFCLRRKV
jgi:hypothetical protein